jgi:hypothetical protein
MTELNTLEKKTAPDLWREDLAAFMEELEVPNRPQNPPTYPPRRIINPDFKSS